MQIQFTLVPRSEAVGAVTTAIFNSRVCDYTDQPKEFRVVKVDGFVVPPRQCEGGDDTYYVYYRDILPHPNLGAVEPALLTDMQFATELYYDAARPCWGGRFYFDQLTRLNKPKDFVLVDCQELGYAPFNFRRSGELNSYRYEGMAVDPYSLAWLVTHARKEIRCPKFVYRLAEGQGALWWSKALAHQVARFNSGLGQLQALEGKLGLGSHDCWMVRYAWAKITVTTGWKPNSWSHEQGVTDKLERLFAEVNAR